MNLVAALTIIKGISDAVAGAIAAGRDDITEADIDAALDRVGASREDAQAAIDAARRRESDDE